jgi:hypothetical protein
MNDYFLKTPPEPAANCEIFWAFDLGKGSLGEAVRRGNEFLHKASLLIPAKFWKIKMGLKLSLAPVQELRLLSGSSYDLRSQADRFLRTADPQVLIS